MGNFWIPRFPSFSSSSSSTRPSSPGIAQNTSNEGTHSGTGSAFSSRLDEVSPNGQILPITPTLKIFSFAELKKATRYFRPHAFVGEGGFGKVFKGWIDEKTFAPTVAGSGMAIAVKILNSDGFQGWKEWQSEVDILGSHSHPNIVKLLGYCWEDKKPLLLVYEFMPRGTLADHLFSRLSGFQSLSWSIRLKIAIGVARGVAFLHCSKRKIIYHSVIPSDILLDSDYNPKIYVFGNAKMYDFGAVRDGPQLLVDEVDEKSYTFRPDGYVAPDNVGTGSPLYTKQLNLQNMKARLETCGLEDVLEFPRDGHLYEGSDVYCFGILLLEMLSGMRALDRNRPREQQSLVKWAQPFLSDRRKAMLRVMDRRLEGQYPSEGAVKAAQLIIRCLSPVPGNRPSMTQVVEALEQIQAIKHDPKAYAPRTKD